MKLIVGLGNPGKEYENTRHNAGFFFVDALREKFLYQNTLFPTEWRTEDTFKSDIAFIKDGSKIVAILQKPSTFMNLSGEAVSKIIKKFDIESSNDLILAHDDLDIQLGEFKIQKGKSPLGHNGVLNVEEHLGIKDFKRVRIGVENRADKNIPGLDYVLMKFKKEELLTLEETMDDAINGILTDIIL
ncbi:MAG: Peptidyl-tRNA hydrolase [candidate division WS6 bacterium GW2011_GWC2_36_7]|uniref:Peptidyl-tRNA hydrolase n=1 Tax=candidate division WS6 bacterium GW2011_GWC2_36_7 TaxID=1619091 RepID=A0A0G0I4M7_9BACT|nr:MAG: Peptidyl-tRNA hydrolase [candidate division WS6 bacterium GW2011_GWC2_36_7]HAM37688.1 aminoacyl-tRNA hydrolase [Patescibacteria group bacterium]HAM96348.1 aminoacyl-tRNA hydrolase [Patescibacteria group bacterium]